MASHLFLPSLFWQRNKQYSTVQRFHLNKGNINLAHHLVWVLEPFYDFTLQVSTKASAHVAEVIVLIDQITASLSAVILNENLDYPPALRNACCAGLSITNKYYSLTNCSPIYRIAMGECFSKAVFCTASGLTTTIFILINKFFIPLLKMNTLN
jgi:hypothetical protein